MAETLVLLIQILPMTASSIAFLGSLLIFSYILHKFIKTGKIYDRFAKFICVLCLTDVVSSVLMLFYAVLQTFFEQTEFIYWRARQAADILFVISCFEIALISVYWKHVAVKNIKVDVALFFLILIPTGFHTIIETLTFFFYDTLEVFNDESFLCHVFWACLIISSIICFICVMRIDPSKLSAKSVKLLRRMAFGLLIQTFYNAVHLILTVVSTIYSIFDDEAIANGTDNEYLVRMWIFIISETTTMLNPLFKTSVIFWCVRGMWIAMDKKRISISTTTPLKKKSLFSGSA